MHATRNKKIYAVVMDQNVSLKCFMGGYLIRPSYYAMCTSVCMQMFLREPVQHLIDQLS